MPDRTSVRATAERIFDNEGLRVTTSPFRADVLTVEVTVIGGDWTINRETATRLRDALTLWLGDEDDV